MTLDSLLLTRDQQVVGVLRPALEKLAIEVEVCRGAKSGNEILSSEKFDAVIIDCDDLQGGLEVLENMRKSPSNKNSVIFALLNGKTTTFRAFELGAKFVLQKPVSQLNAMRCFSAALGFMVNERRRYFRHPLEMPVLVSFGEGKSEGQELKATATNISDGGMAIRFRGRLPRGRISRVQFSIPDSEISMEPKVDFAWVDGSGRAGLRFVELPKSSRDRLERWLTEEMMRMKPAGKE